MSIGLVSNRPNSLKKQLADFRTKVAAYELLNLNNSVDQWNMVANALLNSETVLRAMISDEDTSKKTNILDSIQNLIDGIQNTIFSTYENPENLETDIDLSSRVIVGKLIIQKGIIRNRLDLTNSRCLNEVIIASCEFRNDLYAQHCVFSSKFVFANNVVFGRTRFTSSIFNDEAELHGSEFQKSALFNCVKFNKNATFAQANFSGFADFSKSIWSRESNFRSLRADRAFLLEGASFILPPDFTQAIFSNSPDLRGVNYIDFIAAKELFKNIENSRKVWTNFAPLRKIAKQQGAIHLDADLWAIELKARRIFNWKPYPESPFTINSWSNFLDYWVSGVYSFFSASGRSMFRPVLALVVCTLVFAIFYSLLIFNSPHCDVKNKSVLLNFRSISLAAEYSFANIMPLTSDIKSMLASCVEDQLLIRRLKWLEVAQRFFSGVFVFLFVLGLRHRFRIR